MRLHRAEYVRFCIAQMHDERRTTQPLHASFPLPAGVASLVQLTRLTSLNVSCCLGISDVGLRMLSGLPNLASLDASRCMCLTPVGLASLGACSRLTSLDVSGGHPMGPESVAAIGTLTTLKISLFFVIYRCF